MVNPSSGNHNDYDDICRFNSCIPVTFIGAFNKEGWYNIMKKTKEINGEVFTVIVPKEKMNHKAMYFKCSSLETCYVRPSNIKRGIYESWMRWASDVEGLSWFGIQSYNCMMFTLTGLYYDIKEDKYYHLYISKTRQELTELA